MNKGIQGKNKNKSLSKIFWLLPLSIHFYQVLGFISFLSSIHLYPYGVDVLHQPALHPIFSYWVG